MRTLICIFFALILLSSCKGLLNKAEKEKELQRREQELKAREEALLDQKKQDLDAQEKRLEEERKKLDQKSKPGNGTSASFFATGEGNYPEGSSRMLTRSDLVNLSSFELKIMRNEIFARHGLIFKTEDMQQYFAQQKWYKPLYSDVSNALSATEKRNVDFIKGYE